MVNSRADDEGGLSAQQGEPRACYRHWRAGLDSTAQALLAVEFLLPRYWLADGSELPLTALYHLDHGRLRMAVTDRALVPIAGTPAEQFERWVAQHQLLVVSPDSELELQAQVIAKPWGREIWYSGVEVRGVCEVVAGQATLPLPWLRAILPDASFGDPLRPLLLLKILDPSPEPVSGDLYFELHRQKREAYIVTRVDPQAWPDGTGYIRYGFSRDKRSQWPDEGSFRQAYCEAVAAYELVRRQLDRLGDSGVDEALLDRERQLRAEMDSFTHLQPLRAGDVVTVPTGLPHGLLHGVRTIEFQTPVYERHILSFAQQVLTQDHWDTAEVLQEMLLEAPPEVPATCLVREAGVRVERIIDYPDFEVHRIALEAGASLRQEIAAEYGLAIVAEGELTLNGCQFQPGRALLLPRAWSGQFSAANPARALVLLLALPRS